MGGMREIEYCSMQLFRLLLLLCLHLPVYLGRFCWAGLEWDTSLLLLQNLVIGPWRLRNAVLDEGLRKKRRARILSTSSL